MLGLVLECATHPLDALTGTAKMIRVYIGWDVRDAKAYQVAEASLLAHASIEVEVVGLFEHRLRALGHYRRAYMMTGNSQRIDCIDGLPFSTDFSFTRFLVPWLAGDAKADELVVYTDPDVLWRSDIARLLALCDTKTDTALWCVHNNHQPVEERKALGVQTSYPRKNWSSVMVFRPSQIVADMNEQTNMRTGRWLHTFRWLGDDLIGKLPESWNLLEGSGGLGFKPDLVHYTRGTPDFDEYKDAAYSDEWRSYL